MSASETSAIGSLKAISTANLMMQNSCNGTFAGVLSDLGPMGSATGAPGCGATGFPLVTANANPAGLLDPTLGVNAPTKSGYTITYTSPVKTAPAVNATFSAVAAPLNANQTGRFWYCVDQSNIIYQSGAAITGVATGCPNSLTPIGN